MRVFFGLIVIVACAATAMGASVQDAGQATDATAAKQALERNVALGQSLGGKPATAQQAAQAESLYGEALAAARAAVAAESESADAHRMVGLVLCTGYRPVVIAQGREAQGNQPAKPPTTVLLRGAAGDCGEGLAELRSALTLSNSAPDYALDYADAMLACGDAKVAQEQATAIWEQRASLSKQQSLRCARVLAECARSNKTPDIEIRWLQEVLKLAPKDKEAGERIAKLGAGKPGVVTWNTYETGVSLAGQLGKPMLIDFSAEWCGWCKKLEKEVFPTSDFISVAQKFVCIKVDADARPDLTKKHRVDGYPTAVILDSSGREMRRIVGYKPAKDYVAELRQALPRN